MFYNVEIYKTKIDNDTLNNTLLQVAKTLEENGDSYIDNFPITLTYHLMLRPHLIIIKKNII